MRQQIFLSLLFVSIQSYEYYSLADTFQAVQSAENALKEEFQLSLANFEVARENFEQNLSNKLNESLTELTIALSQQPEKKLQKAKVDDVLNKLKAFGNQMEKLETEAALEKKNIEEKIKKDFKEIEEKLKTFFDEKKEEKENKREQLQLQFQQVLEKFQQQKQELNDQLQLAKQKYNEKKKQKLDDLAADLNEVKTLITEEIKSRYREKVAKKNEQKSEMDAIKHDIEKTSDNIKMQKETVQNDFNIYKDEKKELKELIQKLLNTGVQNSIYNKFSDHLQSKLDEVVLKEVINEKKQSNIESDLEKEPIEIAQKSTILDEITGKGAWETVTWVLLAHCILLSVAMIVLIIMQIKQKNQYERLGGANVYDSKTERDPLILSSASPITAPPLAPTKEELQF